MPLVSVIIPVYNEEKYLAKCLDSVISQTFKDIEIICVNDGSTDNSPKILIDYAQKDNRIKIINKKNGGISSARNAGLDIAKGEYIIFVDSDDWIENNLVELAYNKIFESKADIVIYSYNIIEKNKVLPFKYAFEILKYYENKNILLIDLININHCIWDRIFRKQFLIDNNIRFPDEINQNEDGIFDLLCLVKNAKYSCLPCFLYNYLSNRKNSIINNSLQIIKNDIIACKYFLSLDIFKSLAEKYKIIAINKFLNNLKYNYTKNKYKLYRPIYNYQLNKFFKYLSDTIDSDILDKTVFCSMKNLYSNKKYILNHIFSIKNIYKNRIKFKQFMFCFIKIKFKVNPDKKEIQRFNENIVTKNSILIVEPNNCHGETISGYAKMFTELGYDVDIVLTPNVYKENPLCKLEKIYYKNVFSISAEGMKKILCLQKIKEYEYLFFNSYQLYYDHKTRFNPTPIFEFFKNIVYPQNGFLALEHHLDKIDTEMCDKKRIIQLGNIMPGVTFCNSHYYGKIKKHEKNNITEFVIVGTIAPFRKNFDLLINTVEKLTEQNINHFHINIIGQGKIQIPSKLNTYISILGRLSFYEMFNYVEKSDFIMTLLDPHNDTHLRYLTEGTSGTFQLSYGFCKPILINSKFAQIHYFNEKNSIIYNDNFEQAFEKCINMPKLEYYKYVKNLKNTVKNIETLSLNNLREVLETKN